MAKYDVTYACGHTGRVELFGKSADRQNKIAYFEQKCLCPECYRKAQSAAAAAESDKYVVTEMHYRDYKNDYADCATVAGSYNAVTKTIKVYVPAPKPVNKPVMPTTAEIRKAVMVRAWAEARRAADKFGGKSSQYIAEAMRQAWAQAKVELARLARYLAA